MSDIAGPFTGFTLFYEGDPSPVIQPIPVPTPDPGPCDPIAEVGNGGKGASGCNVGGEGFVSMYDLGDGVGVVPQHPDPVEGEDLTNKTEIDIWVEVDIRAYPSGTITTYRRSFVEISPPDPPSYEGGRKPEGLFAIGDFEYALAQEAGTLDISFSDASDEPEARLFRSKLGSQHLNWCEVRVKAASPARRLAQLPAAICYRGVITKTKLHPPLIASISSTDVMFGPFSKLWPPLIPQELFPTAPKDTLKLACPVLYGERSDEGATDPRTGVVTPKGLMPFIYAGRVTVDNSVEPGVYQQDLDIPVPEIVTVTNIRPSGDRDGFHDTVYLWLATRRNSDGKISSFALNPHTGTAIVYTLNPAGEEQEGGSWPHIHAQFAEDEPNPDYSYIGFASTDPNFHPITNPGPVAGFQYGTAIHDGVTRDSFYGDFGSDGEGTRRDFSLRIPAEEVVAVNEWGAMIALLGESYRIVPYGSNLVGSEEDNESQPDRIRLTGLASRSDIMCPWDEDGNPNPNWPFPDTFVRYVDSKGKIWDFTMIFVKGVLLDDHLAHRVTMAFNAIGRVDDSGIPFMTANPARQCWLDNDVLSDFTGGDWVDNTTAPKWSDGTYKVRSSAFTAHQDYTEAMLGSVGLKVSWYAGGYLGQKTCLEHDRDWNEGTEADRGTNNQGQLTLGYIDETLSTTNWPKIIHQFDIFGEIVSTHVENLENQVRAVCDWDDDFDKFRVGPIERTSDAGLSMNAGHLAFNKELQNHINNDAAQVAWVLSKRLARLQFGEVPVDVPGPIWHLSLPLDGPGILLTSIEGRGASGYVDTPMRLMRKRMGFGNRITTTSMIDGTGIFGKTTALAAASGSGSASAVGTYLGWKAEAAGIGTAAAVGSSFTGDAAGTAGGTGTASAVSSDVFDMVSRVGTISMLIDGLGSVITTGVKGFVSVPVACTITSVRVLSTDAAATNGSIVVDIWKDSLANYPPTVADTITASAKPTLSSNNDSEDTTLTGWTTALNAGDVLGFNVDSVAILTRVLVQLTVSIP